jgi:trimeric autotransporter adhesin
MAVLGMRAGFAGIGRGWPAALLVLLATCSLPALRAQGVAVPPGTPPATTPRQATGAPLPSSSEAAPGSIVHGTVKSGTIPLPGVGITATNTLTGQKYSTATDIDGAFSMTIPANGRYVLKADLVAFAPATQEVLLTAGAGTATPPINFALILASRAEQQQSAQRPAANFRRYANAGGAQNLDLLEALAGAADAGIDTGAAGAALPSLAGNSDFSNDSVAVSGQAGTTSPFAGIDMEQLRQTAEANGFGSGPGGGGPGGGGPGGGGPGGGGPGGGGPGGGGGFAGGGGFGGRGGGGGGGGRGFGGFRNLRANQPHGAFFWTGANSALDAKPFPLRGQAGVQPSYAQNQFGFTFLGSPYVPRILTHDTKDVIFITLSGQRSSSPFDQYGTVPTAAERTGNFSGLTANGVPVTIYDPTTGLPFPNNTILPNRISPQAKALLNYFPMQNLPGTTQNYQRITSTESNTTKIGFRYIRSFGSGSNSRGSSPIVGLVRQYLGQGGTGLRQNVNVNFNYSDTAADELNLFPSLGGSQQIHQYSLAVGYSLGKGRLTNSLTLNWNRTGTQLTNYFTNTSNVAAQIGLAGLPTDPRLFGLPNLTLNQFTGMNEEEPNFQTNQTISLSETSSWIHKKHNIRYGGDVRRVHLDLLGDTGNATGTYTFTGLFTEQPGTSVSSTVPTTSGSSLADLLLGLPQQTSLQAPYQTSYLRQNVWDAFVQDDWRFAPSVTLNYGLRYEYFSPYSEKYDRLSTLDTGDNFAAVATVLSNGIGQFTGKYPRDLVYPEHDNFAPRLGFAIRAFKDTVVRGGYGINYAVGQYLKFVQDFAFEPPYANVQTNETTSGAKITLANGFPASQADGNYAVNKYYRLPYVQVWNLNIQRTIPGGIVLNFGYNGSKGTRLDIVDAPGRTATASESGVLYDYENSVAFSNYNAFTLSARRRLHDGIALAGTYTYSHSIDNASSIGGNGGTGLTVAQNWQDLLAEESNSSFDVRNNFTGNALYELPFGPDAHRLNTGWLAHALSNFSLSTTFQFASGTPLTPSYAAAVADVARGSTGSLRPDRVFSQSLTAGGGSLPKWFNTNAFAAPANVYGTASRFSIPGPGTVSVNGSLSKTIRFAETRTFEMRATADNVFNTVQYSGVDSTLDSAAYGQVTSVAAMRQFTFLARMRY